MVIHWIDGYNWNDELTQYFEIGMTVSACFKETQKKKKN